MSSRQKFLVKMADRHPESTSKRRKPARQEAAPAKKSESYHAESGYPGAQERFRTFTPYSWNFLPYLTDDNLISPLDWIKCWTIPERRIPALF